MLQNRNSYYNQEPGVSTSELVRIKQCIENLDERVSETEEKVDDLSNQVITECAIADNVSVNQKLTADNIEAYTVKSNTFTGNSAEIDVIDATKVEADEVKATDATFSNLVVDNKVNELSVGTLHTDTFSPTNISTNVLTADAITSDAINTDDVVTCDIHVTNKATIDTADIETADIMNGNIHSLSSDTITVREITADKTTVTEVDADTVKSIVSEFTNSTISKIKTNTISSNGKLNADPQGESHYSIDIPNYDNALVQLSGVYSTNDKWSVNILKAKNTAYISASETTLDGILDISYEDGKIRLRVKSDGTVNYSLYVNEENPAPITISPLGDHYMPYYYVPEKLNTYTLLGYDDTTSQFYIPGTLKVYQITADYVSYESLAVIELRADKIELPKTHDSGGGVSEYSYGNARDYVSVSDDELVNEYHTPVEHANNGALANSTCLIAESAITEYNGTKKVDNVSTYPITNLGDSSVVHGKLAVEDDTVIDGTVAIKGDLWVDGTTHTVDEEEVVSQADTITLRANNSSSLGSNLSGLVINKYNGTDDLGIVADSDGTLRVGTGTGTETSYPTISYDYVNNKWYTDPTDPTTEVTPVGNLTSWASKEKEEPFTTYTNAVFTLFDKTSLEPVMTRDESADMTDGQIVCWDNAGNKAKTTNCIADNVTFAKCVDVGCDLHVGNNLNVECSICACSNVDTGTVNATCVNVSCCLDACNAMFNDSVTICCDLRVCGSAIIHGLTSDCVAVQENICDHAMYPTFVCRNNAQQQGELLFTDCDLNYNPHTNTLTTPNVEFQNAHGNNVTADLAVTTCQVTADRIMSPNRTGLDTSLEIYQHNSNNTYTKTACFECGTFKYTPLCCSNCCGNIQFMGSGNTTFVDQCNYVNNGCLYTCGVITSGVSCLGVTCISAGGINRLSFGWLGGLNSCPSDTQPAWGNQTGTAIAAWYDCTGGSLAFRRDNPTSGQMSMLIDGTVYVDEGRYSVIHEGNIGSQCVDKAVCLTDGTAVLKAEYSNEYNMYDGGAYGYINYRGGVSCVILGNGSGTGTGTGTLVANLQGNATKLCADCVGAYPVGTTAARIWNSPSGDSYGICTTDWRNYISVSNGDYDANYGLSFAMPFWDNQRFAWRVRDNGTLCPIHELIDNRGGQRVAGALCIDVICPAVVDGQCGQSRIEYTNASFNGCQIHDNQTCALYIESREAIGSGDSGGIAITNDGVTVFGAGDTDGVLRVVNEDDVSAGAVFRVYKDGTANAALFDSNSSTSTYAIRKVGGGALYMGESSISLGNTGWAGSNCQNISIGACDTHASSVATVAIGSCARAISTASVAIGNVTSASSSYSVVIGNYANAYLDYSVAIGSSARTIDYGLARVDIDVSTQLTKLKTVTWYGSAMQCDIYKAITDGIDLSHVSGQCVPEASIHFSTMGTFGYHDVTALRFDKCESPSNIDFLSNGSIFCTIHASCTATVDRPGMIAFLGSC